jgi:iron-sulfur cluster repair protein YtfE (RIC family)
MPTFSERFGSDHDACDNLYARAEEAVGQGNWEAARGSNAEFLGAMARHFGMEEEILFPAFEEASGSSMGPTQVMRHEHAQMRQLFEEMIEAVEGRDADGYLGAGETLLILMQQHNAKEEQILYPMTDRLLDGQQEALFARLDAFSPVT